MLIRLLQESDLPVRVRWMNDSRVYSSMHYNVPVSIENTIEWFNRNQTNRYRSDVTFVDNGRIIAFGGLTSISESPKMAELYIFVDPTSHNRGFGVVATSLLCRWGFLKFDLSKIYLITNGDNLPAIRTYKKCGFTLEGRHRQEYVDQSGELKDRLYFGLLKSEWIINNGNHK